MPIVLPEPGSATMTCHRLSFHAWRKSPWKRCSKGVSMKPVKRDRATRFMAEAPLHWNEWRGGGQDTPSQDLVWLRAIANERVAVVKPLQVAPMLVRGECLRVVDQAVVPFPALWLSVRAVSLSPQFLLACVLGLLVWQALQLLRIVDQQGAGQ